VKIVVLECARGMEAGSGDLTLMRWIGDIRLPFVEPKLGVTSESTSAWMSGIWTSPNFRFWRRPVSKGWTFGSRGVAGEHFPTYPCDAC